jgi:hypothetical protein
LAASHRAGVADLLEPDEDVVADPLLDCVAGGPLDEAVATAVDADCAGPVLVAALGVPPLPGRSTHAVTAIRTMRAPSSTKRRRQYVAGGSEPTG